MKKISNVMRGVSSVTASVLALSVLGTGIANSYRKNLDEQLGTTSYVTSTDEASARFVKDYSTIEDMAAAAKDIAVREGEEGTVIMKNDNNVFPIAATQKVALFGMAAYAPYRIIAETCVRAMMMQLICARHSKMQASVLTAHLKIYI